MEYDRVIRAAIVHLEKAVKDIDGGKGGQRRE